MADVAHSWFPQLSACRCDQTEYNVSEELENRIRSKLVRCREEGCRFQSTLAEYLLHSHGKAAYSNAHVDFACLRPRLLRPPSATENSSQAGTSTSIRSQLLQVTMYSSHFSLQCHLALSKFGRQIFVKWRMCSVNWKQDELFYILLRVPNVFSNVLSSLLIVLSVLIYYTTF